MGARVIGASALGRYGQFSARGRTGLLPAPGDGLAHVLPRRLTDTDTPPARTLQRARILRDPQEPATVRPQPRGARNQTRGRDAHGGDRGGLIPRCFQGLHLNQAHVRLTPLKALARWIERDARVCVVHALGGAAKEGAGFGAEGEHQGALARDVGHEGEKRADLRFSTRRVTRLDRRPAKQHAGGAGADRVASAVLQRVASARIRSSEITHLEPNTADDEVGNGDDLACTEALADRKHLIEKVKRLRPTA